MPLETATFIDQLVPANPAHTDGLSQADSHMRLLKSTLQATFPNFTAVALASTQAQIDAVTAAAANTAAGLVPAGTIIDFGGTTAPAGYLPCDGGSLTTTGTYAALFAAIGYTWGGSGAAFNAPALESRFRRHRDNSTLSGAVGTLQAPANLTHTHGVTGTTDNENANHSHSGTTGTMGSNASHSHTGVPTQSGFESSSGGIGSSTTQYVNPASGDGSTGVTNTDHTHAFSTGTESAYHGHTFTVTSGGGSADSASESRPFCATVLTCIKY